MGASGVRLPFIIGVTGHRDLREEDISRLEAEVSGVIARLKNEYLTDGGETPIVLLSALAEGADRLVARIALAEQIKLVAPIPMPPEEYCRDFVQGESLEEFWELYAQAEFAPVMPFTEANSMSAVRNDEAKRAEQYRAVGLFIVKNSDLLIALWDGDDRNPAPGGTAEVVAFKQHGIPLAVGRSAAECLDGAEIGPIIHIVTPRRRASNTIDGVLTRPWGDQGETFCSNGGSLKPLWKTALSVLRATTFNHGKIGSTPGLGGRDIEIWQSFGSLLALTADFNHETAKLGDSEDVSWALAKNVDFLFLDQTNGEIDQKVRTWAFETSPLWCQLYGVADLLAKARQAAFRRDWLSLFVAGFLTFSAFSMFGVFEAVPKMLVVIYATLMTMAFAIFTKSVLQRNQERYLDYRALAEALRVGIYWNLLSARCVPPSLEEGSGANSVSDRYPIKQPNELAWVKSALRKLEFLSSFGPKQFTASEDLCGPICRLWVCGQRLYFAEKAAEHRRLSSFLESVSLGSLFSTWILLVLLIFFNVTERHLFGFRVHDILLVTIGVLPGLAAALTGYSERLALQAQARQYDRMRDLFDRAYALLPDRSDRNPGNSATSIFFALGVEAMKETADWVATYRQRPIRPLR